MDIDNVKRLQVFYASFSFYFYGVTIIQDTAVIAMILKKSKYVIHTNPMFTISILTAELLAALSQFCVSASNLVGGPVPFPRYDPSIKGTVKFKIFMALDPLFDILVMMSQWCQFVYVVDALLAVRFPMMYHTRSSRVRRRLAVALMWLVGILIAVAYYTLDELTKHAGLDPVHSSKFFLFFLSMTCIPGPLSMLLFIYIQVLLWQARARSRQLQGLQDADWATRVLDARTGLLLTAAMSIITSFGYPLHYLLGFKLQLENKVSYTFGITRYATLLLGNFPLVMTPLVFAYSRSQLWKAVCKKNTEEQSQEGSTKQSKLTASTQGDTQGDTQI